MVLTSIWRVLLLAACIAPLGRAWSQGPNAWPTHPVRIVAPFAAGGTADILGRIVAQKLSDEYGQTFVVENRAGAGGLIGADIVSTGAADGNTLVVSGIASLVLAPAMTPASFDPIRDFAHIALLGGPPDVFLVAPTLAVRDLKEFIALARASSFGYGSPGSGTQGQLIGELFRKAAGIDLVHVPYKGAGPAVADVMAGHLPAASVTLTSAVSQIQAGKVRALALTSHSRLAAFPDVPTFTESGFPQLVGVVWFSLSGPAGLPPELVTRLNTSVRRALHSSDVLERLHRESIESNDMDAVQFTEFVKSELARWTPVIRAVVKP